MVLNFKFKFYMTHLTQYRVCDLTYFVTCMPDLYDSFYNMAINIQRFCQVSKMYCSH